MYESKLQPSQVMRPRLLRQRRDELVILCIRHHGLCSEARLVLKPEYYNLPDEKPHQLILRHLWHLLDQGYNPGEVPEAALYNAVAQELACLKDHELDEPWVGETINDPTEPGWEQVTPGLIYRAYRVDLGKFADQYAFETLRLFMEERSVIDAVARLVMLTGARVPVDHTAQIDEIVTRAHRIEAIGSDPFLLPLPEGWKPAPLTRFPTGVAWVDDKLGGQVAGDVNGLLGMFGGGKTTGMTQIAVGSAFYFCKEAEELGSKPRVALLVSYEEREETIRPRILSCAARISKTKLEEMGGFERLSRRGALDNYELAMYRAEGEENFSDLDGEYERFQKATVLINQSLRLADMRAAGRGRGWVDELAGFIARFRDEHGVEVGVVCIDYVNAMCRRYIDAIGKDPDRLLRHYAQATPLQVEEKIARRFRCPVWLAQQFSGEANKRAPTARMMLADASEARSFGENLVFCFAFGATDPQTQCIQCTIVKARRRGIQGVTTLVRLDGDLGRITPVDHLYTVRNDRIIDLRTARQFSGIVVPPTLSAFALAEEGNGTPW